MLAQVNFIENVIALTQHHHKHRDFGSKMISPPVAFLKAGAAISIGVFKIPGGEGKMIAFLKNIFPEADEEKVELVFRWLEAAIRVCSDAVDNEMEALSRDIQHLQEALDAKTDVFDTTTADQDTAEAYKSDRIKLRDAVQAAQDAATKYGMPENMYPLMEQASQKVDSALQDICIWGVRSLLKKPGLMDEKEGKDTRKVLRDIWVNQVMDKNFRIEPELMDSVTEVLAVDKSAGKGKRSAPVEVTDKDDEEKGGKEDRSGKKEKHKKEKGERKANKSNK